LEFDAQMNAHQVVILENTSGSVVAINQVNDTIIAKVQCMTMLLYNKYRCEKLEPVWWATGLESNNNNNNTSFILHTNPLFALSLRLQFNRLTLNTIKKIKIRVTYGKK